MNIRRWSSQLRIYELSIRAGILGSSFLFPSADYGAYIIQVFPLLAVFCFSPKCGSADGGALLLVVFAGRGSPVLDLHFTPSLPPSNLQLNSIALHPMHCARKRTTK